MSNQQFPVRYDDNFSQYNSSHEGLVYVKDTDTGFGHIGGMIKGSSTAPLVANQPLVVGFVDDGATQSGEMAVGVATVKVGSTWEKGICMVDQGGAILVQFPISGVVQWCVIDITYLGPPTLPTA